jgi:hypothetical protein
MSDNKDKKTKTKVAAEIEALVTRSETAIQFKQEKTLENLPEEIREALADFDLRELVGIAPSWNPKGSRKDGKDVDPNWIAGHVIAERHGVGPHLSSVLTVESNLGVRAVWFSTDMKLKLGDAQATGRNFVFQFDGWLRKADMPNLKNDMKLIKVIEVLGSKKK